jgi:protein-tyrosine phosphatase
MTGGFSLSLQLHTLVLMYKFNPALSAITAKKERYVWLVFMGIVFFMLYGASNQVAGLTSPHPSFFMPWEEQMPFIEIFIIPYMSSDLMFIITFLLPYTRLELRVLAARVLFIIVFSTLIFVLYPLQFSFDKPEIQTFNFLFGALQADLPYNQLPSLHISFAIVLWVSMKKHINNKLLRAFTLVWFLLIAVSTLLVFQHHFIDIPTGAIMGLLAVSVIEEDKNEFFVSQFTTPRSLKMGLYFLVGSIVCLILSFNVDFLMWIFLYIFVSLFSVSIVYAFGLNTFLVGKNSKANLWQWMLYLPYFLGSYLSWLYYKRKIPLIVSVKDRVYLGRFPSKSEYSNLQDKDISCLINLAAEQQCHTSKDIEIRFPFLDQTIQSPSALHKCVELIEAKKEDGVYVHCALGLSRSVLLISAWLLYNKHTIDEIDILMGKIRPSYVRSAYMDITLQMYQNYINEDNNR